MRIRKPAVAGQFYGDTKKACLDEISDCIDSGHISQKLPETIVAGIVPHAGWTFSGTLAAMVFSAIKMANKKVDTFIIFGAAHSYMGSLAAVYDKGMWRTPLGDIAIDETLAAKIINAATPAEAEPDAHKFEHSIEVQIPFIQHLFPEAKIVPVMVPPATFSLQLGYDTAQCIKKTADKKVVCIGSTDLTHYGPRYGFCPKGTGPDAIDWAKDVNDQNIIDLICRLESHNIVAQAQLRHNACGAGAVAATVAAAVQMGAKQAKLLSHICSAQIAEKLWHQQSSESVGYAGLVFG